MIFVYSSCDPTYDVSFEVSSSLCVCHRLLSLTFNISISFSQTTGPIITKLSINVTWVVPNILHDFTIGLYFKNLLLQNSMCDGIVPWYNLGSIKYIVSQKILISSFYHMVLKFCLAMQTISGFWPIKKPNNFLEGTIRHKVYLYMNNHLMVPYKIFFLSTRNPRWLLPHGIVF